MKTAVGARVVTGGKRNLDVQPRNFPALPPESSARLTDQQLSARPPGGVIPDEAPLYRDTSTPAGELIFHVMAAIGQFERALIGDRIRSGLARARALGKSVGRPRTRVSPEQVLALRAQGLSYRAVARHLHISPALAHRLAEDVRAVGLPGRSETSPARLEMDPTPSATPEAAQGQRAPATKDRRNP